MTDPTIAALISILVAIVLALVAVNIWYHRERQEMTPGERAQDDHEMRIW